VQGEMQAAKDEVPQSFGPQLGALLPILNTVNTLLDLDTYLKFIEPVVKQAGLMSKAAQSFALGLEG
jgi:hypothetical protein